MCTTITLNVCGECVCTDEFFPSAPNCAGRSKVCSVCVMHAVVVAVAIVVVVLG